MLLKKDMMLNVGTVVKGEKREEKVDGRKSKKTLSSGFI